MEAMEAILSRRSIRRYTGEPVPEAAIRAVLAAAMSAPSAGDERPWHFVVVTDRAVLAEVPKFHPHSRMVPDAGAAILVCGDPALEKHPGFWIQDCAAATQNILLAAVAMGLGAVWLGIHPLEDRVAAARSLFGLPAGVVPLALVPLGVPAVRKAREDRFDAGRVHRDRWGGRW